MAPQPSLSGFWRRLMPPDAPGLRSGGETRFRGEVGADTGVGRGHVPLLRLPLPPIDVVAALLEAAWPAAVLEVVGVVDLDKGVAFGGLGAVSWRGGGPGGGSRVGRGWIARLECGQATMAARAAWLWALVDRGGGGGAEAPGFITYPVQFW